MNTLSSPSKKRSSREKDPEFYEVDRIVAHRWHYVPHSGSYYEYQVRWKGYESDNDSWVPRSWFTPDCKEMIDEYHRQNIKENPDILKGRRTPTQGLRKHSLSQLRQQRIDDHTSRSRSPYSIMVTPPSVVIHRSTPINTITKTPAPISIVSVAVSEYEEDPLSPSPTIHLFNMWAEKILDYRFVYRQQGTTRGPITGLEYQLKWQGLDQQYASWFHECHFKGGVRGLLIDNYMKALSGYDVHPLTRRDLIELEINKTRVYGAHSIVSLSGGQNPFCHGCIELIFVHIGEHYEWHSPDSVITKVIRSCAIEKIFGVDWQQRFSHLEKAAYDKLYIPLAMDLLVLFGMPDLFNQGFEISEFYGTEKAGSWASLELSLPQQIVRSFVVTYCKEEDGNDGDDMMT